MEKYLVAGIELCMVPKSRLNLLSIQKIIMTVGGTTIFIYIFEFSTSEMHKLRKLHLKFIVAKTHFYFEVT